MQDSQVKVLLVNSQQDEYQHTQSLLAQIHPEKFVVDWVHSYDEAAEILSKQRHDVYVIDVRLGKRGGLDLLPTLQRNGSAEPVIVTISEKEQALTSQAMQLGAVDCLVWDQVNPSVFERSLRHAVRQKRINEAIEYRLKFEELITTVSTNFINLLPDQINSGITTALEMIGRFAGIDRSFVFKFSDDGLHTTMTHEWCRDGVEPVIKDYQRIPLDKYSWLIERVRRGELTHAVRLSELPAEASSLCKLLQERKTRSFAVAPMVFAGVPAGMLGFSTKEREIEWSDDLLSLLKVIGQIFVSALDRHRVESALRESEGRFRTLIESLGEGIVLSDAQDIVLHVNSRLCELTGYLPEEMIGRPIYELIVPSGQAAQMQARTARRLQGICEQYEFELQRKDGSLFWSEINATPIRDMHGAIVGTVGAVTDISERKRAVEALRASEKKYRNLVETSSDLIWSVDIEGRWTFINKAVSRVFGYTPEEMLGRSFTEFQTPLQAARDREVFAEILSGKSYFQYETQFARKDGSPVQLSLNAIVLRDENGKVIGATGTASDVTEKKVAEAALKESEERFRRYFELPLIGISMNKPNKDWIEVNDKMCELLGYTRAELLSTTWANLTHPEDIARDLELYSKVLDGELDGYSLEKRYIRKDGSVMYATISVGCVRAASGVVDYFIALVQDITEKKLAEEEAKKLQRQLIQSQKMEAIGQLAAGIAHDLNNALAAVVGHLQLLKMSETLHPQVERSTDIALTGCTRATSLIEQLLGFSRQGRYNLQPVSLQTLVSDTVNFLEKVVGKDMNIVKTGQSEDLIVMADQGQMQHTFTNLIINAKHAMPTGGTITFNFSNRYVEAPERFNPRAKAGSFAVVKVSDTGVGIDPDKLDKIFEPFFTTKPIGHGTGLGLSMAYGTVQNHSGWIEVDSEVGKGTCFTLYFPRISSMNSKVESDLPRHLPGGSGTVMVIDDEPYLVDLGKQFLERAGFSAKGFIDAKEALIWYKANFAHVDLIILDMKMPKMDGRACFSALRQINPNARVVILSGYIQDASAQKLLENGAVRFFQKPLKYPELIQWISENIRIHP